jgi:catechol 2,3-dioxygenase-like lactoylglutathione lyase family enzyme
MNRRNHGGWPFVARRPIVPMLLTVADREPPNERRRVRALGVNHVALEVDSVDAALEWWGRFLAFDLRGHRGRMAWIDLGDQFIALSEPRAQTEDSARHFGLVVDGKEALREALRDAGVSVPAGGALRFRDPWGNNIEVVDYRDVQFTKTEAVLAGMGSGELRKSDGALAELRDKGLA